MSLITVNNCKCTKCGICSKVCPSNVLDLSKNGPIVINENNCIACGQCVAICPNKALDNIKSPLANQISLGNFPVIDSKTSENFLRSRRSIRCYKNDIIPKDTLLKLMNISRYAPTASNSQNISYKVLQNRSILKKISEVVYDWMELQVHASTSHWSFKRHLKTHKATGKDTILRDAPQLVLAMAPKDFKNGRENTIQALSYVELFAPSLGLGSCFAGLFEMCAFSNYLPLLDLLNIPKDMKLTGALMLGYPKYKFQRLVERDSLNIHII